MESLKGKGVFLWFFEETCPKARAAWPKLMSAAEKHADDPIVFIAVNSGNPRLSMQSYAQTNRIAWPILVDPTRKFEQVAQVNEISLQNIYQARIITPDGRLQPARWDDVEGSIQQALEGAAWQIEPAAIPEPLRRAWLAIELGDFGTAAPLIEKSLKSTDAEQKRAAKQLQAAIEKNLREDFDAAKSASIESTWAEYQALAQIRKRFEGIKLPPDVLARSKELAADPGVRKELAAAKLFENASKMYASGTPNLKRRSVELLEKIVMASPETEAAKKAQEVLTMLAVSDQ